MNIVHLYPASRTPYAKMDPEPTLKQFPLVLSPSLVVKILPLQIFATLVKVNVKTRKNAEI